MKEEQLSPEERQEVLRLLTESKESLLLKPRLQQRHQTLYEMIVAKSGDPSTTSILELGCSSGDFVEYLREQGYNAEGIDIDEKAIERSNNPHLYRGDIACLDDVVGERAFDFIVATGLFNIGTQVYYLFGKELNMDKLVIVSISPEHEKAALANIEKILKSTFKHLTPNGFFMTIDNIMPGDYTAFTPETATNIGYMVKYYARQEAILQKPLTK